MLKVIDVSFSIKKASRLIDYLFRNFFISKIMQKSLMRNIIEDIYHI